jgi:hypothetical protein
MFIKAFSKDVLANPANRIIEQEWLRLFIRMRSEIYKCPCGEVYFADPVTSNPCPSCGKTNDFQCYIKTYRYNLPVHRRTKLYTCHTEKDSDDFQTLSGEVTAQGGNFELANMSDKNWNITADENITALAPNTAAALKKGMCITFGNAEAEII